jgi:hypothetical protein
MGEYWSWLLTIISVYGLWIVGSKKSLGWLVNLGSQVLWVLYAIDTKQYGFIVGAIAYGSVYLRNYLTWKKTEHS